MEEGKKQRAVNLPPYPRAYTWGAKEYQEVLRDVVKPWMETSHPKANYLWQQDSVLGHKSKSIQRWCKHLFANLWPADFCPPLESQLCTP